MVLDHYISFKYMSVTELQRTGHDLRSDPSEARAGWYLRAYSNEGYTDIVKYTYVPPEVMEYIALDIQTYMPVQGKALANAVRAANTEHENNRARGIELLEQRIKDDTEALARMRGEEPVPARTVRLPSGEEIVPSGYALDPACGICGAKLTPENDCGGDCCDCVAECESDST